MGPRTHELREEDRERDTRLGNSGIYFACTEGRDNTKYYCWASIAFVAQWHRIGKEQYTTLKMPSVQQIYKYGTEYNGKECRLDGVKRSINTISLSSYSRNSQYSLLMAYEDLSPLPYL
jgi:hypothetical protein